MRWRARASGKPAWKRRSHRFGRQTRSAAPDAAALPRNARNRRSVAAGGRPPRPARRRRCRSRAAAAETDRPAHPDLAHQGAGAGGAGRRRGAAARWPCRTGGPGRRRRRASARHCSHGRRAAVAEARPYRRRRRPHHAARFDGRGRSRRGLCAVRRTRRARAAAVGGGDRRTPGMVGRIVRAAVRGLCRLMRRGCRIRRRWSGLHPGRRFHLGRSARRGDGADRGRAGDPAGARYGVRQNQGGAGITPEMKLLRPISIFAGCLMLAAGASAQIQLTPPAAQTPPSKPAARKETPKPKAAAAAAVAKKPAAAPKPAATPTPTPTPTPTFDDPNVDSVYGAYQRGLYKTTFDLATTRAQYARDPKAMTMLGQLYANALGVKRDYAKAAEWYQRAADGGDREGMFALAMMRLAGRGRPVNRQEAVKLLASSAKLGNPKAAYNLALP